MSNNVLIIAEQRDGVLKKVAFEMLGAGARLAAGLGGSVEAVLLGSNVAGLAATLAHYGAARVYLADDPALASYSSVG
jgi:electron transfer flavoprotein alpha subunit